MAVPDWPSDGLRPCGDGKLCYCQGGQCIALLQEPIPERCMIHCLLVAVIHCTQGNSPNSLGIQIIVHRWHHNTPEPCVSIYLFR